MYEIRDKERENELGLKEKPGAGRGSKGDKRVLVIGSTSRRNGILRREDGSGWGRPRQAGQALSLLLTPASSQLAGWDADRLERIPRYRRAWACHTGKGQGKTES